MSKKTSKQAASVKKKPAGRPTPAPGPSKAAPRPAPPKKANPAAAPGGAHKPKAPAPKPPAPKAGAKAGAAEAKREGHGSGESKAAPKPAPKAAKEQGKAPEKKPASKAPVPVGPAPEAKAADAKPGKSGRKGITIVTPKPVKKPKAKASSASVPALSGSVFGMGFGSGRPLIPSGPALSRAIDADGDAGSQGKKPKSPFNKRQLDQYRDILISKRRELLGDIDSMENEALKSESGSLSNLPQHMAEQGSETYEQSLSLDLAAADRVLLREIDAALARIAERTYGLCEHTGRPISKERLAELPWARYSIEAAREMERRAR